ncbi:MAG: hypothetical protein HQL78_10850 [Magnetococcales bacterium]|nr:hypothetical protein [Magnetococcales bacterium]
MVPLRNDAARGFTFIEVLVAIVGIGMVVSGLTATLAAALKDTSVIREANQATFVAQATMEDIIASRRIDYNAITTTFADVTVGSNTFTRGVTLSALVAGDNGCPTAAAAGCQMAAVVVTGPAGGVARATMVFSPYDQGPPF